MPLVNAPQCFRMAVIIVRRGDSDKASGAHQQRGRVISSG